MFYCNIHSMTHLSAAFFDVTEHLLLASGPQSSLIFGSS